MRRRICNNNNSADGFAGEKTNRVKVIVFFFIIIIILCTKIDFVGFFEPHREIITAAHLIFLCHYMVSTRAFGQTSIKQICERGIISSVALSHYWKTIKIFRFNRLTKKEMK